MSRLTGNPHAPKLPTTLKGWLEYVRQQDEEHGFFLRADGAPMVPNAISNDGQSINCTVAAWYTGTPDGPLSANYKIRALRCMFLRTLEHGPLVRQLAGAERAVA